MRRDPAAATISSMRHTKKTPRPGITAEQHMNQRARVVLSLLREGGSPTERHNSYPLRRRRTSASR
jgi:hypothetical protein